MAILDVVTGAEAWLEANWSTTAIIKMSTVGGPPKDGSEYVLLTYPVSSEEQKSIGDPGNNIWRDTGAFQIMIYAKRGAGLETLLGYARDIAALYRGKRINDSTHCMEVDTAIMENESATGHYVVAGVAVAYRHDLTG